MFTSTAVRTCDDVPRRRVGVLVRSPSLKCASSALANKMLEWCEHVLDAGVQKLPGCFGTFGAASADTSSCSSWNPEDLKEVEACGDRHDDVMHALSRAVRGRGSVLSSFCLP